VNSAQRLLATLHRQLTDQVPVTPIFGMPFLRQNHDPDRDFIGAQLQAYADLDADPMVLLKLDGNPGGWPNARQYWLLHHWPEVVCATWNVQEQILGQEGDNKVVSYTIDTPAGTLHTVIEYDDYTHWIHEYPLKQEQDVELLAYRPDPAALPLARMLDAQLIRIQDHGLGYIYVPGVWHQACDLRGSEQLMYDVFDRPDWVRRLFGMLREYIITVAQEMSRSRLRVLMVNESYVGLGISPTFFHDFVFQDDQRIVGAIHEVGLPTVFHVCGRSQALLELMADTGADGIETLTPPPAGGDVSLSDAKRRVGDRVCLRGGFNQHVLAHGDETQIVETVQCCLEQAAEAGGYILGPTGFLTEEVSLEALHLFCSTARTYSANRC
jgi:uroporphyrinogen decarboxylase